MTYTRKAVFAATVFLFPIALCAMNAGVPMTQKDALSGFGMVTGRFVTAEQLGAFIEQHPGFVHHVDQYGRTPLYYAVMRGSAPKVQVLLNHGANAQEVLQMRIIQTILANGGDEEIARLLREATARFVVPVEPIETLREQPIAHVPLKELPVFAPQDQPKQKFIKGLPFAKILKIGGCFACAGAVWWYFGKRGNKKSHDQKQAA